MPRSIINKRESIDGLQAMQSWHVPKYLREHNQEDLSSGA